MQVEVFTLIQICSLHVKGITHTFISVHSIVKRAIHNLFYQQYFTLIYFEGNSYQMIEIGRISRVTDKILCRIWYVPLCWVQIPLRLLCLHPWKSTKWIPIKNWLQIIIYIFLDNCIKNQQRYILLVINHLTNLNVMIQEHTAIAQKLQMYI